MDSYFQIDIRNFGIPLCGTTHQLYHVIPCYTHIATPSTRPRPGCSPFWDHLFTGLYCGRVGARGADYRLPNGVAKAGDEPAVFLYILLGGLEYSG